MRYITRRSEILAAFWWLFGAAVTVSISGWAAWGPPPWTELKRAELLVVGVLAVYAVTIVVTRRMASVDIGGLHPLVSLLTTAAAFSALSAVLLFARTYYSRSFLLTAAVIAVVWLLLGRYLKQYLFRPTLAVEPDVLHPDVLQYRDAHWVPLTRPGLPSEPVDAVIANRESTDPDWQRFHTRCEVEGLPVYHGPIVSEQLTGRVSLDRLSSGHSGELHAHPAYAPFKRALDLLIVVGTAPLTLPIVLFTAVAIKLDTPGPLVFTCQDRTDHIPAYGINRGAPRTSA